MEEENPLKLNWIKKLTRKCKTLITGYLYHIEAHNPLSLATESRTHTELTAGQLIFLFSCSREGRQRIILSLTVEIRRVDEYEPRQWEWSKRVSRADKKWVCAGAPKAAWKHNIFWLSVLRLAPSEATWPPCLLLTWAFWIEAAQRGNNNIVAASLNTLRTNGEKWSLQNMSTFKTRCFHCFQCSQIHFTCFKKITWLYSLIQYLVWTLVKVDISCRPCI